MQTTEITPTQQEWSRLQLHDIVCTERITMCHAAESTIPLLRGRCDGSEQHIFVPGDLDIQNSSE